MKKACGLLLLALVFPPGPAARSGDTLLIVAPMAWEPATADFVAFKRSLGFSVSNVTVETLAGGGTLTPGILRTALVAYAAGDVPPHARGHVLFIGDFDVVPAPPFLVLPADGAPYESDVVYRDLATDFDADGDGILGEFDDSGTQDFTGEEVRTAFPSFTNHLLVGRLPLTPSAVPADVENALAMSIAFEEETGARKAAGIMTAGRIFDGIDTGLPAPWNRMDVPADSWTYVLSNSVDTIVTEQTNRTVTTVVHVSPSYTDRHNIDYAVVGDDITGDYTHGQDIVRGLWQTNDACAFLCNVSHGGATCDFALRRNGAGFPSNVSPAVVLSMSCASWPLGVAAWTSGVAVAYLGSVATVTPDVESLSIGGLPPGILGTMVSAEVQDMASRRLFVDRTGLGRAFAEAFDHYAAELPGRNGGAFLNGNPAAALRNVIGYQIIGDPTLVVSYDDSDADGLLDPQEIVLGSSITNADTDADGLPDGYEVRTSGTSPTNSNTDGDMFTDYEEMVAATDGTDSNDFFRITGTRRNSVFFNSSSNRLYTLLGCSNLLENTWTIVPGTPPRPGVGGADSMTDTNLPPEKLLYRMTVELPPP